MLTVCLTNIVKMEDEYLIQTLINKGINYHELINTIN